MSVVKYNLLNVPEYMPYCGNINCLLMPRTKFNGEQFYCSVCGWQSNYDNDFIKKYKEEVGYVDEL